MSAPPTGDHGSRRRGQLLVASAAVAWSTAGVLQRELSVDTQTQVAGRALIAFVALAGYVAVASHGRPVAAFRSIGYAGLGVAVCIAVASGSFIVALNHATVASVFFVQALAPSGRRCSRGSCSARRSHAVRPCRWRWRSSASASWWAPRGAAVLSVSARPSRWPSRFAAAIVITRHKRDVSMAPAVCLSQLVLVLLFAPFADFGAVTARDFGLLLLLGAGQMALGLALFTAGARLIPASEVALISLLEVVLGPLWVFIAIAEQPPVLTLVGGGIIIVAVLLLVTQPQPREVRRLGTAPSSP